MGITLIEREENDILGSAAILTQTLNKKYQENIYEVSAVQLKT